MFSYFLAEIYPGAWRNSSVRKHAIGAALHLLYIVNRPEEKNSFNFWPRHADVSKSQAYNSG
jgi:hypothetical protein